MDEMRFVMLMKKRGVKINREIGGISIAEILGCLSEEVQEILEASELNDEVIEKLLVDSMKISGIKNIDSAVKKKLNDAVYLEELKNQYN